MRVTVRVTESFIKAAKPLLKKYPSLSQDLHHLESELILNPKLGTALGSNLYKIRLSVASKGKGKSGGARVISLLEAFTVGKVEIHEEEITVNLLTIYDKASIANIPDKELKELIKAYYNKKR